MEIKYFRDEKYKANSFVIIYNNKILLIDINVNTLDYLKESEYDVEFLFLTHEHFDHIKGVLTLKELFPNVKIVASKTTANLIKNKKTNLSYYFDGVGFEEDGVDIFIEDENEFIFQDKMIKTYNTPGHSEGGIVISIDNILFTGDTLLDVKTPVNFPNSSKAKLKESLDFIDENFSDDTIFYQGHGKPFSKKDWNKNKSLGQKL